jgi:hypothetical protein
LDADTGLDVQQFRNRLGFRGGYMNQEDLMFMMELLRIARSPDAVKRFSTDKELMDRMVEVRRKYSRQQFDELSKQAEEMV